MLKEETKIKLTLEEKFPYLREKVRVIRVRRISLDVENLHLRIVLRFAVEELHFPILATITGSDENPMFGVIYSLASESGIIIQMKTTIPREKPVIASIIDIFRNAEIYERELVDLLGIEVEGLPAGNRYPLPDNWPPGQYPLRKDWDQSVLGDDQSKAKEHPF
jgi:membrane-bound hydrogenase subunit beta